MTIAVRLLAQNPKFVPAIKLKAMLQEDAGKRQRQAALQRGAQTRTQRSRSALKTGIYKLATGESEQAIKLLERCAKLSPMTETHTTTLHRPTI